MDIDITITIYKYIYIELYTHTHTRTHIYIHDITYCSRNCNVADSLLTVLKNEICRWVMHQVSKVEKAGLF